MKFERLEQIMLALTAVGAIILTGVGVVSFAWILATIAGQFVTPMAFAQTRPAVELERAINQEQVDGDLNAAIAAYQKIAGKASAPRDVRAKALLQLAGCYEKLGRQAAGVYQQIVRDFADQPAAAQARTRLAAMKKEAAGGATNLIARKIIARNFAYQTDGQSVVYRDFATGELIAGDLAGRVKRVLFKLTPGESLWWAASKDFSMVAIAFPNKPDRPAYIAVVKTDGTGYRELVRNDEQGRKEGLGFDFVRRLTWSWDNQDLLVAVSDKDVRKDLSAALTSRGCLLVVSVSDGKRRRLADVKGGFPNSAMFSPDGRFAAYEVVSPEITVPLRIFVVPVTGGKPSLIHEERGPSYPGLIDWTADGRYLAITASAAGGPALHLFPVEDGQAAGPPIPVRAGQFYLGSMTPAGALASWLLQSPEHVAHVASLDADGRPGPWQRLDFAGRSLALPVVQWSPDGTQIAYTVRNDDVGQLGGTIVRVRNLTTGQDRELRRSATPGACVWGPQPSELFCGELPPGDLYAGRVNLYAISLDSGAIEQLGTAPVPFSPWTFQASRDGRAVYLAKPVAKPDRAPGTLELVRWELATGQETVMERDLPLTSSFRLSPDQRWLIRAAGVKLEVRPTSGGDWKPLVTVNKAVAPSNVFHGFAATPDSKWVVYRDVDSAGKHGLFRVPISGGAPERLGDYAGSAAATGAIAISPDGRKILATGLSGEQKREPELWLLENFVPAVAKR